MWKEFVFDLEMFSLSSSCFMPVQESAQIKLKYVQFDVKMVSIVCPRELLLFLPFCEYG